MSLSTESDVNAEIERQTMEVDIACAGFGPAMGGFLTALTRELSAHPDDPAFESKAMPGMPLRVLCYERADDISAGVSGVVTSAEGIRASFPDLDPAQIPMAIEVKQERVLYLLDPVGASRRSFALRAADTALRTMGKLAGVRDHAFELPWTPAFLNKHGGLVLSMGQFNQWVGLQLMASGLVQIWQIGRAQRLNSSHRDLHSFPTRRSSDLTPAFLNKHGGLVLSMGQFNQWVGLQLMASGLVQIWPGTPVSAPLFSGKAVQGLRLTDQGVDRAGGPADGFMAGMDVLAKLTVVGDGPVGAPARSTPWS